ncbi:TPM domain-containing protein [Paenibacillus massiliensis]|uniref:TPM domain-containing protein n=1 Tax=Paenibacillus massiliensis TaxID=225917 RepID=UPI000373FE2D|nr:TPM domain-containing protein [Paenibacillus massiliensis]
MKKYVLFVMMFLLLFTAATPAMAKQVPESWGAVTDRGGFFTKQEVELLAKEAKKGPLQFRIITFDSLAGEDPAAYATRIYKAWRLDSNDVILLMSKKDRRIELNFHNDELRRELDQLAKKKGWISSSQPSSLTAFLNKHFIPSAKANQFAKGVTQTMTELNRLYPAEQKNAAKDTGATDVAGSAGSSSAGEKQPGSGAASGAGEPGFLSALANGDGGQLFWNFPTEQLIYLALMLVFLALLALLLYILYCNFRWERVRKRIPSLIAEANQQLSILDSYDSSQGHTLAVVQRLKDGLHSEVHTLSDRQQAEGRPIPMYKFRLLLEQRKALHLILNDHQERIQQLSGEVRQLQETDRLMHERMVQLVEELDEQKHILAELLAAHQLPLTQLVERYNSLNESIQDTGRLKTHDPLKAYEQSEGAQELLASLRQHLTIVPDYVAKHQRFPGEIQAVRLEIEQLTLLQQLEAAITRLNPYEDLEQALALNEHMYASLEHGHMEDVLSLTQRMDELKERASSTAERQVEYQRKNKADMPKLLAEQPQLASKLQSMNNQFYLIQKQYAEHHWAETCNQLEQAIMKIEQLPEKVAEAEQLTEPHRQQLDEARAILDEQLKALDSARTLLGQAAQLIKELEQRHQKAKSYYKDAWKEYQIARKIIAKELPVVRWKHNIQFIEEHYQSVTAMLQQEIIDLDQIEQVLRPLVDQVHQLRSEIHNKVKEKKEAMQRWNQLTRHFNDIHNRASRTAGLSGYYLQQYQIIRHDTLALLEKADFEHAMSRMSALQPLISQMNQEYSRWQRARNAERQAKLARQQREAELRRQHHNHHNNHHHHNQSSSSWSSSNSYVDSSSSSSSSSYSSDSSDSSNRGGHSSGGSNW